MKINAFDLITAGKLNELEHYYAISKIVPSADDIGPFAINHGNLDMVKWVVSEYALTAKIVRAIANNPNSTFLPWFVEYLNSSRSCACGDASCG